MPFLAASLQTAYWEIIQPFIFLLFYPAVFVSAWLGGLFGGGLATLVSASLIFLMYIHPPGAIDFVSSNHLTALSIFILNGFLITWIHHRLQQKDRESCVIQQKLQAALQGLDQHNEALLLSENRFKQILHSHPIAVLLANEQGVIEEANPKAGELLHCPFEDLIGLCVDDLMDLDKRPGHAELRALYMKNPSHRQMSANREVSILAMNGHAIPVEIGLGPLILAGNPHVIITLNDISRRKQAEKSLIESQDTLQRAQKVGMIGSWKLLYSKDRLLISEQTRQMFGLKTNMVSHVEWFRNIHPSDKALVESAWLAMISNNTPFDIIFRVLSEEKIRWFKSIAELNFDVSDNLVDVMGTVQDITNIKETELQMQKAMKYLQLATKASGMGIWAWDLRKNHLELDERMMDIYGLDNLDQTLGLEQILSRIHPDDKVKVEVAFNYAREKSVPFDQLFRICLPNGVIKHIKLDSIFENDEYGNPIKMIGVNHEVTDTVEQEYKLIEAIKNAELANKSKSNFLANMSHEIRTPMNAIMGLTSLVLDTELTRQQREYLKKVQGASRVLLNLINDVLDYSKIEAGQMAFNNTSFSLEESIGNSVMLFSLMVNQKKLALEIHLAPNLPLILIGDSLRLEQVLNNLIGNAVKFTEQGKITLRVEPVTEQHEQSNVVKLLFSIRDTGIGINPAVLQNLFLPFTQADVTIARRFGGTGLGLSICKRLVEQMGGELTATSVEGQGSVFSFTACFDRGCDSDIHTPSRLDETRCTENLKGAEILVVEDSSTNQLVVRGYLEKMHLNVAVASNGREAIEWVREQIFDVILMDIQMPIMDGYEATKKIRHLPNGLQVPIIALSASVMHDDIQSCLKTGMNDHLSKPIDIRLLEKCLIKWITPKSIAPSESLKQKPSKVYKHLIEIDHQAIQPLLLELEQLLAENMLDAKKVAERIDLLLEGTSRSEAFLVISDQVRRMRFKDALAALKSFDFQVAMTSDEDEL